MIAPDKLYVHITPHLGLLEATAIPVDAPGEQVYIRKDALIEWANETYFSENASAIRKVCFKQLVEKLNSL